jgi:hypothetical protein
LVSLAATRPPTLAVRLPVSEQILHLRALLPPALELALCFQPTPKPPAGQAIEFVLETGLALFVLLDLLDQ